jgi:small subunit ribosomal protein S20
VLRGKTRTVLRQARQAVAGTETDRVQSTTGVAVSAIDRAVTKGLFHKNKAARLKSRLTKQANTRLSAS